MANNRKCRPCTRRRGCRSGRRAARRCRTRRKGRGPPGRGAACRRPCAGCETHASTSRSARVVACGVAPAACAALSLEACGDSIGTQLPGAASLHGRHAAADNAPADAGHSGALTEAHGKGGGRKGRGGAERDEQEGGGVLHDCFLGWESGRTFKASFFLFLQSLDAGWSLLDYGEVLYQIY